MKELTLVLTCKWYDKIASRAKTHEYREIKPYWVNRLTKTCMWGGDELAMIKRGDIKIPKTAWKEYTHVTFMRAYTKTKMTFTIKSFSIDTTPHNDLGKPCIDIELGERTV